MEKKLRHLLSAATACTFLVMALASFGPDTSTHLNIFGTECLLAPSFTVHPRVHVTVVDDNDNPVIGHTVKAFITQQKVTFIQDCEFVSTYENITGVTDADGIVEFQLAQMNQDNRGDLYRVEIFIPITAENTGARKVKYIEYAVNNVAFLIFLKSKSVL